MKNDKAIIELIDTTNVILREINDKRFKRADVAKTVALALRSSEETDWRIVKEAIEERWSLHAVEWILDRAWSGKAFEDTKQRKDET